VVPFFPFYATICEIGHPAGWTFSNFTAQVTGGSGSGASAPFAPTGDPDPQVRCINLTVNPGATLVELHAVDSPGVVGSCSVTQGGWGAPPNGNNWGAFLKSNFNNLYSGGGLTVGGDATDNTSPYGMKFVNAKKIEDYLPAGSTPGALSHDYQNPTTTESGVFGGQVLTLRLSVDFDAAGLMPLPPGGKPIGEFTLVDPLSPYNGQTVSQILAAAETALSGGGGNIGTLNSLVDSINNGFDNCVANDWAKTHLAH